MKYQIAYGRDDDFYSAIDELEKMVKRLEINGYKPQGGISIHCKNNCWYDVCQAMVKED